MTLDLSHLPGDCPERVIIASLACDTAVEMAKAVAVQDYAGAVQAWLTGLAAALEIQRGCLEPGRRAEG